MSNSHTIIAEMRDMQGTSASRRLRHAGKIPAVLYGAGKDTTMLTLSHNSLFHNLEDESFHSSILTVEIDGKKEKAILRDVQMHAFKQLIMHVDLQRISAKDKIHMNVPLHFTGGEEAPGVKVESGIVSHLITELDIVCLPVDLPEFISIDISTLNLGDSVHLSEIELPDGVESTIISHGGDDLAVVTVVTVRAQIEEETAEEDEEAGEEDAGEDTDTEAPESSE
ncbi:50S ribosomal protein L25 [bacterium BMS3Bbin11]|nr:50S ribosomal protein L25 [bacterium BMS3Abin11]GBE45186.1 50S ribosomal protein L25 [bacterium BMS3Bbin11]GMT41547.1 MAG: 50S ribosomal protein L25 [bacterium]HDH15474.1 50S ribosomal protein L25/general stress protein Ctc [Gammaproteobacteria bacterium]